MQIVLSEKDRELLEQVDTSKFGWGNSEVLKQSETFRNVAEYSEKVMKGDIVYGK